jgi:hypothetical protein
MDEGMQTEEKAMKKCRGQESMAWWKPSEEEVAEGVRSPNTALILAFQWARFLMKFWESTKNCK